MIAQEFIEMAKAYHVLTGLEPQQLRKLLPLAEEREFKAGEIIFRERDRSSHLYLIVSGEAVLEIVSPFRPIRIQTLHAGDATGWSALDPGGRTHFQARALTPVVSVAFPGERLREACNSDPAMGYVFFDRLLALVTERLDATRMQVVNLNRQVELTRQ